MLARHLLDHDPQLLDLSGQRQGEFLGLVQQDRCEIDEQHRDQGNADGQDQCGGERSREAQRHQSVDNGVQGVGDDHADDEWEHDVAQQPDRDNGERKGCEPEKHLPFDTHRCHPCPFDNVDNGTSGRRLGLLGLVRDGL